MYFDEPKEAGPVRDTARCACCSPSTPLVLLVLGILPQKLMQLCYIAINTL